MRLISTSLFAVAFFFVSALSAQTAPTITGILNTADFGTRICPGALASVFGTNFGSGAASTVTVTVAGKPASVTIASPNQLSIQIPVDAAPGMVSLVVTVGGVASTPFAISLDTYAPALFTANGSGTGNGLLLTPAGTYVTLAAPAKPGDSIVIFGAGFGPTSPQSPTGTAPAGPAATTSPVTITVGKLPATVSYAGATPGFLGLYQVNFTVPAGLQGTQPVIVSIGGRTSAPISLPLFGISSVVSNASFGSPGIVAPGSIVSVFANGIGTTDQSIGFPATTFQGVSVTFNGTPAPIFHLTGSQGQIDLLVPYELPTSGTVQVQLKTPSATTANFAVTMSAAAPGLYYLTDPATKGRTNVLAQFNNTAWLALPDATATALKIAGSCAGNQRQLSLALRPTCKGRRLSRPLRDRSRKGHSQR